MHTPNDSSLREPVRRVPSCRRYKPTGRTVVTLNGRGIYLGKYGTAASRAEYDRLVGEWPAAGRCLSRPHADLTVAELVHRYWHFAKGYYVMDGHPGPESRQHSNQAPALRSPGGCDALFHSRRDPRAHD